MGVGAGGRRGKAIRLVWFGRFVGCAGIRVLGSILALLSLRRDTQGRSPLGSSPSGYWPSAFEGLWQWCGTSGPEWGGNWDIDEGLSCWLLYN